MLPGEEFYLRAFWLLDSERATGGMTVGRIPWSKAMDFARQAGLEVEMLEPFWLVISAMDAGFRDWQKEQHDRQQRRQNRGSGGHTGGKTVTPKAYAR